MAYNDVDLNIYRESSGLHYEMETVKHLLQQSLLELSREKEQSFQLINFNHETIIDKLNFAYNNLFRSEKINISFVFELQCVHNCDEIRYYYAADNNPLISIPIAFSEDSDLIFIKSKLRGEDFLPNIKNQRPDKKSKFLCC